MGNGARRVMSRVLVRGAGFLAYTRTGTRRACVPRGPRSSPSVELRAQSSIFKLQDSEFRIQDGPGRPRQSVRGRRRREAEVTLSEASSFKTASQNTKTRSASSRSPCADVFIFIWPRRSSHASRALDAAPLLLSSSVPPLLRLGAPSSGSRLRLPTPYSP